MTKRPQQANAFVDAAAVGIDIACVAEVAVGQAEASYIERDIEVAILEQRSAVVEEACSMGPDGHTERRDYGAWAKEATHVDRSDTLAVAELDGGGMAGRVAQAAYCGSWCRERRWELRADG